MLNVLFFAQTRELIGVDSIQLEDDFATAEAVREHLAQKGDKWALALEKGIFPTGNRGLNDGYSNFSTRTTF
ncbi:MAG: MoaD/ThiS family protein [Haemophilus parainfluenzae]|nr:MoaD/ThiS family protein [Haemophilus parainfluenzae]